MHAHFSLLPCRDSFSALLAGLAICDTLFMANALVLFGLPKLWPWFSENVTNPRCVSVFNKS